jgi:polysaccharide deacetylase family protein (PEP-CTERM system associated)
VTLHGLSFDLEDWHQLVTLRMGGTPGEPWRHFDECVDRVLEVCEELECKATFFVVGLLARSRPGLVRRIADCGHEIASHSVNHRLVHTMSRADLLADLRTSKRMLEDMSGMAVTGFRAPEFSVQRLDSPCFELLIEAGYTYDSSVFPVPSLRYGIPDAPSSRFVLTTAAGSLVELPLATTRLAGIRVPIAGGSHFRLLPARFVSRAARRADARGEPLVFYFHPYEFTRRLLYLPGGFKANRSVAKLLAMHNLATSRIEHSLRRVARDLRFAPLRQLAVA